MEDQSEPTGIDWTHIEEDWVAGIKSQAQMSREYGVTRRAIEKHCAEKLGLKRDLAPKIREEAERQLQRVAVAAKVAGELAEREEDIVQANAERQVAIRQGQRKDAEGLAQICAEMSAELLDVAGKKVQIEQLILAVGQNDDTADLVEQLQKMLSLSNRAATFERLVAARHRLMQIENDAWGLTAKGSQTVLPAQVWIDISGQ